MMLLYDMYTMPASNVHSYWRMANTETEVADRSAYIVICKN